PRAKRSALEGLLAEGDELVRNFLLLLAEKGRIGELEPIQAEFERLVAADEGVLDVELTTAYELSDDEAGEIVRQIEQSSGRRVGDGIARVYGLENAVSLEMLDLEHGVTGLAFNLEEDNVGTALFGPWEHVKEGEPVRRTGRVIDVPVGDALVGRIVDPLGN